MFEFTQRYWFRQIKIVLAFICMIPMCGVCAFHHEAPIHIVITGWFGLLFFGGCGLIILYRKILLRRHGRKYIMITEQGLVVLNDVIPWTSIIGFRYWDRSGNLILVLTNDCKEQIAKAGWLKRKHMQISYKMTGAVFSFPKIELDGTLDDLFEQCKPFIKRNKKL